MAMQELQMIVEQFSAPILAQLTQELLISIGQGNEEDPLVQIRQQELDLRGAELAAEQDQFAAKQESRRREKLLEAEIAKQRINTSKEVADDKLDLALQRLQQQANLKLTELQTKFGGSR
jgi:tmRNA-binding protein